MNSKLKEFLSFERMISPFLIQIFFWVGVLICVVTGIWMIFSISIFQGLWTLVLGPIVLRIICETAMLFFRMFDTLTEIKHSLNKNN